MSQNLKLNEQNNNFSEFNIIVETWIDIRDDFILPLRINIADIDFNTVHYIYNKFEKDKTQLIVDVRKNPFEDKLIKHKLKLEIIKFLKFVDNYNELYDEGTLFKHLGVCDYEELYQYLLNLEFSDSDFFNLRCSIINYINQITEIFTERAFTYLKINKKVKKSSNLVGVNMSNYDTEQTQTFIKSQSIMEYHTSMPFFKENIGKSIDEISWRELQMRMLFLHRKNQIDSELKNIESDVMKTPSKKEIIK